ncbi:MAG: glycosyltransferase [Deltaproteobacteria bacterium]|nr:glycosyltransferase [Deltaproteobacteria bacterium]
MLCHPLAVSSVISVLLPFRDAAATLHEAVSSVLEERTVPLEVIAVDDGSRDGGAAIVHAMGDPRVRVVRTEGVGIPRALNVGLAHARGAFIGRMDADDVSLPGRFPAQRAALEAHPRVAAVGTRVSAFPDEHVGEGLRRYVAWMNEVITPEDHVRELFVEAPLCHPSVLMRREALTAVDGYRHHDGPEDYDLWLRLHAAGHALAKVPEVLLRWRHHPSRATLTDERYSLERFAPTKAPHLARAIGGRSVWMWGAGKTGKHLARALEAHGVRAERWIDIDPRKIGGVARGAPIVGPSAITRGEALIVVAVGARGARQEVRSHLVGRGLVEGEDFVCAS